MTESELGAALIIAGVAIIAWWWRDRQRSAKPRPREEGAVRVATEDDKWFPVGLVGERNFQEAIAACREGDDATIWREPDNPYDERALAVTAGGKTIGYIPRDCFLQRAIHDERQGCEARILSLNAGGPKGMTGVAIEVALLGKGGDGPKERGYRPR